MKTLLIYGKEHIEIKVPDSADIFEAAYPEIKLDSSELVYNSIKNPINSLPLSDILKKRRNDSVVIVVSDITRPIPYHSFLQVLLDEVEENGILKSDIKILVATGMHRKSTKEEHIEMFGENICENYCIIDHDAEDETELVDIDRKSKQGRNIILNRYLVEAGCKIVTGLVEPHFMAGFSGGRKSICPGLVALDTIKNFHGFEILDNENSANTILENNPCHKEALSIAEAAEIDFVLNVVINKDRQVVGAFSGDLNDAHKKACDFVKKYTCPKIEKEYDIVITSSGGYPLDATFYQCVKGMVSSLPAVKKNGIIISLGKCCEGIGSKEYTETMFKYSDSWKKFLKDKKNPEEFIKDQWQLQMQTRVLKKIGKRNLFFFNDTLRREELDKLNITPVDLKNTSPEIVLQNQLNKLVDENVSVAVFPDGPYCAPQFISNCAND